VYVQPSCLNVTGYANFTIIPVFNQMDYFGAAHRFIVNWNPYVTGEVEPPYDGIGEVTVSLESSRNGPEQCGLWLRAPCLYNNFTYTQAAFINDLSFTATNLLPAPFNFSVSFNRTYNEDIAVDNWAWQPDFYSAVPYGAVCEEELTGLLPPEFFTNNAWVNYTGFTRPCNASTGYIADTYSGFSSIAARYASPSPGALQLSPAPGRLG
jgi:hypothetical protein